ncbi:hypothetical protein FQN55_008931 [Onygenales sp. PD_40]|nr:hypothetical protein FQN55_008931 [Onygenales sp. PD_40]KAK2773139.1 hypothetical protein FQN53_004253 [Emmonsiellopsis sp. PD_33]
MTAAAPGSIQSPEPSAPGPPSSNSANELERIQADGGGAVTMPGLARTVNTTTNKLEIEAEVDSLAPQGVVINDLKDTGPGNIPGSQSPADKAPVELDEFGLPLPMQVRTPRLNEVESPGASDTARKEGNITPSAASEIGKDQSLPKTDVTTPTAETTIHETDKAAISNPASTGDQADPTKGTTLVDPSSHSQKDGTKEASSEPQPEDLEASRKQKRNSGLQVTDVSEWSHQRIATEDKEEGDAADDDGGWRDMPALGEFDVYDDYGRIVARGAAQENDAAVYQGLGGAGKGYTRVQIDEDAQSATSLDDNTKYLFKEPESNALGVEDEQRDPLSQLQATKDLLTEGQRIAYVGVTRLTIFQMVKDLESINPSSRSSKKYIAAALDSMTKWGQQMMIRLYTHMDIDSAEQVMIEQLAEHGVQPADLVPPLMQNSRVNNPVSSEPMSPRPSTSAPATPDPEKARVSTSDSEGSEFYSLPPSPPPYEAHRDEDLPQVKTPSQLPSSNKLDIDLRWTVLCDLFLVLVSNSVYDARSRRLLERVGETMDVSWVQICRFEKRVIDALEMQEEASKETWDEAEHMESRRKQALKKRYMIMGLATVGGGLVIGLSAGLLAPVIGAGLAAGFTTIGVGGTSAFLGGVGGTALITSGATLTGGTIAIRASNRRTGAVKTFEYRPLHNNKKVNLIVTVSGWMNGKVDDVRLPYSTVDPVMGDIYSLLWEPEMLSSMGATINILATEALTQGLQQVLGSTVLVALMASLQLPIVLTKLSYLIDNPWNVSLVRANAAGLIMADSIIARNLGNRPITLLGFSLGARVIFSCLKELAKQGAHGLIQNVYLFGSPIVANKDEYMKARSVVAGRFVNGYASNDWILGYLFRATGGGIMRVAGLAPVKDVPGIENMDVTQFVNGHMAYRTAMPRLLRELGWEVESDEFTEIEDPDPEKHQERQRELIREIDEARRQAEEKPEKKRFGFFKRGKLAEKKGWETYDVDRKDSLGSRNSSESAFDSSSGPVLFDIDAIRAELESEQIEVRQLESTLPPINLDLKKSPPPVPQDSASEKPSMDYDTGLKAVPSEEAGSSHRNTPDQSADNSTTSLGYPPGSSEIKSRNDDSWSTSHDDSVEMTFDTSYSTPPPSYPSHLSTTSLSHDRSSTSLSASPSPLYPGASGARFGSVNLTHNAWADDDHDDRKDGGGMQMTFE